MGKHIHIRDFDEALHSDLVRKAEEKGMSLSQFLRHELSIIAKQPSTESIGDMLINLPRDGHVSNWSSQRTARMIREGREQRDEQISDALQLRKNKLSA